jgi:hypothetical protein
MVRASQRVSGNESPAPLTRRRRSFFVHQDAAVRNSSKSLDFVRNSVQRRLRNYFYVAD